MLVTPGSVDLPFDAKAGDRMPQHAIAMWRPPSAIRTIGDSYSGKMPGSGGGLQVP